MDAFDVLHEMHEEANSSFQQILAASTHERAGMWAKLRPTLTLHEQIEERFIYDPVAKDARGRDPGLESWEQQHNQQVRLAEGIIGRIGDLDPASSQWLTSVQELHLTLADHIRTEEGDIWPRIRAFWGEDKVQGVTGQVQAAKATGSAGATVSGAVGSAVQSVKSVAENLTGR